MFEDNLIECRDLATQASTEVKKLRTALPHERTNISSVAFDLLKEADEALRFMQQEAQLAPAADRARLAEAERALRTELKATAQELENARRELLLGSSNAQTGNRGGGGKQTDALFLAPEDRKRMTDVTANMQRGNTRIQEAVKQASEAEHIGVETLQELRGQRETIHRIRDNQQEVSHNLNEADQTLKAMEKPDCCTM